MVNREYFERVTKLVSDNPTKYIKIRDVFEEVLDGREPGSANDISDIKYKRICARFQDIDVPFSWCCSKEEVYQLCKAIIDYRDINISRIFLKSQTERPYSRAYCFPGSR